MTYAKVNGVAKASIAKVNGVADADIERVSGVPFVRPWPMIYNFDGDSIGNTGTQLTAKDTHGATRPTGTVQLQDYSSFNTFDPTTDRPTQCFEGQGSTESPYVYPTLGSDEGWVPSDDGEFLIETVTIGYGTNQRLSYYIRDEDEEEGINIDMYSNSYHYCRTMTGGTWDSSWKFGPYGLSRSLGNWHWYYHGIRYNFSNNQVRGRLVSLDGSFTDTGWILVGTVSSPSFDADVRLNTLLVSPSSGTTAIQGLGQIRVADWSDGANDGELETHNYLVP